MAITITSAGTYTAVAGETYIIAPSVAGTVKFQAPHGTVTPVDFTVDFQSSGASGMIEMDDYKGPLSPSVTIADNVDISHMQFDLGETTDAAIDAGDNVSVGKITGSHDGTDDFTFGDNLTARGGIETDGDNDNVTIGDGADFGGTTIDLGSSTSAPDLQPNTLVAGNDLTAKAILGDANDDDVTLGDDADVGWIDLKGGDNTIIAGEDGWIGEIKTGSGADEVTLGDNMAIKIMDLGGGDDIARIGSLNTPGSGTITLDGGGGGSSSSSAPDNDCLFLDTSWLSDAEKTAFFAELDDEGYVYNPGSNSYIGDGNLKFELDDGTKLSIKDFENIKLVCFARETRILTPKGEIPIENLQVGDVVLTMDSGFQEIRWIGSTKVQGKGHLAPVRIKAGTLGNARDVVVSPQHRILLKGGELEVLFGQNEALVAARHLVNGDTIVMENVAEIEYFHMLFDQHEIVYSEGMPSESFHPGAVGLSGMARRTQREIIELFPQLETDVAAYGASCRQSLKAHEAKIAMQQVMSSGAY